MTPQRHFALAAEPTTLFGGSGAPATSSSVRETSSTGASTFKPHCRRRSCVTAGSYMPSDPSLEDEVRAWLVKAVNDLRAAEIGLGAVPPLLEDALFHCQQAVE